MDQYVRVNFPSRCKVWVDGEPAAWTNEVFQIETGNHTFDLGPDMKCDPVNHTCTVSGTMADEPFVIVFKTK